jgi:hypothetical protein
MHIPQTVKLKTQRSADLEGITGVLGWVVSGEEGPTGEADASTHACEAPTRCMHTAWAVSMTGSASSSVAHPPQCQPRGGPLS